MTGYTVHTGTTLKFSAGWDRIFETEAKSGQAVKSEAAKSGQGKKSQASKKPISAAAVKKARGAKRAAKRK